MWLPTEREKQSTLPPNVPYRLRTSLRILLTTHENRWCNVVLKKVLAKVQHDIGTGPMPTHSGTLKASDNSVAMSYNARMHAYACVCRAAVVLVRWISGTCIHVG
jgi:hypothetical protein